MRDSDEALHGFHDRVFFFCLLPGNEAKMDNCNGRRTTWELKRKSQQAREGEGDEYVG